MPALAAIVADLLASPRPVLCLDTCDLLDIIQCAAEGKARRLEHVRRLVETLALQPNRIQLVLTYLVPVEWTQNQSSVLAEVERWVRGIDEGVAEIHLAWQYAGAPLPGAPPSYAGGGLSNALRTLADSVLSLAVVVDRDAVCISRALDRLHNKLRPSQTGGVKDSIHLEHYLELARRLQVAGFAERRVFVSANKADFWEARTKPVIHPELDPQLSAVGLEFFGALEAALGSLGI